MSVLQRKEKKPHDNKQENSFRSSRRSDARGNHRRFREVEGCCLELYSITRRSGAFLFLFFFSQIKLPPMLLLMMMMIDPPIDSSITCLRPGGGCESGCVSVALKRKSVASRCRGRLDPPHPSSPQHQTQKKKQQLPSRL